MLRVFRSVLVIFGFLAAPSVFADSIIGGPQIPCELAGSRKLVTRTVACNLENGMLVTFESKRIGGCTTKLSYFKVDGEDQFDETLFGSKRSSVKLSKVALRPSTIEVYIQDNENGPIQLQASLQSLQNKTTADSMRAVGALTKGWTYFDSQVVPKPKLVSPVVSCSVQTLAEPIPGQ